MIGMLATLILGMQSGDTKDYSNVQADIKLRYPSEWSLKRDKSADRFEFKAGGKTVMVEVMAIPMNYPAGHWQQVNAEINTSSTRAVLRQWEEEYLGVPMLFTRVRDIGKGEPIVILSGLMMSNRPNKFLFRVETVEGAASLAEDEWKKVLLSADTISGKLPSESLPAPTGTNTTTTPPAQDNPGKIHILGPKSGAPEKPVRGEAKLPIDEQRGLSLYLPKEWQLQESGLVNGSTVVKFRHGVADEPAARKEWLKDCGSLLSRLSAVSSRTESEPAYTKAAFHGSVLERLGASESGAEMQWIAYGWATGYYYTLSWTGTETAYKSAKPNLEKLRQSLAVAAD
jgi:hypothetical protein